VNRIPAIIASWFRDPENTAVMACSVLGSILVAATVYAILARQGN
jgi:hypothetical protein